MSIGFNDATCKPCLPFQAVQNLSYLSSSFSSSSQALHHVIFRRRYFILSLANSCGYNNHSNAPESIRSYIYRRMQGEKVEILPAVKLYAQRRLMAYYLSQVF